MSRYARDAVLVSIDTVQNGDGTRSEDRSYRHVFANDMSIGLAAWSAARSNGLHADASIRLRSCDYADEQAVVMDGCEYEVERAQSTGEFTTLTLKRRVANGL